MSTQIAQPIPGSMVVPTAFHSLMSQMTQSELSQNVGSSFAVVSIRGKVFRIKHGGAESPVTMMFNGAEYAAPFYDVVIVRANGPLSKTYYASGYAEGSDEAPTCWSEDGVNPLAPIGNRPKMPDGSPVTDCRLCPMNAFGSKINETTGAKSKACADTRKLVIVPVTTVGNLPDGTPITAVDVDNPKYGGPMLLRVPAASLQAFAEYDRKLQAMGMPYFSVVTRLQFDQTTAYPKFVLTPVRAVRDDEASRIVEAYHSLQVQQILGGAHTSAPPAIAAPAPVQAAAPTPAPVQAAAPTPAPVQAPAYVQPVAAPAPVTAYVQPVNAAAPHAAAPAPVAVVQPVVTLPAPYAAPAPTPAPSPAYAATPAMAAPAPAPAPAPAMAAPAPAPAPDVGPSVSGDLLARIDQILDT